MPCSRGCCDTQLEHYRSIGIAAAALPNRRKTIVDINRKDRQLDKDRGAYKRLRRDGTQPPQINGSAALETRAEVRDQVDTGFVHIKPRSFDRFEEQFGHRATEVPSS